MNKDKYTPIELSIFSFLLMNSFTSTILIKEFNNMNTVSIILSIICSFLIGFIFLKIYINSFNKFNININKNGLFTFVLKIFLIICSIIILLYSTFNLSLIIKDIILPNMNQKIISITFLCICYILAIKGIKSITIASNLMFMVYIVVVLITFFFNLFNINPINLLPIKFNLENISFYKILILTISPLFMLLIISKEDINNFKKYKKYLYISYTLFYSYLIIKILFIVSILGIKYFSLVAYPEIDVLKMINIFNFFERLEEILIINIFIQNLITSSLSLNYIYNLSKSIIKSNKWMIRIINAIILLLIIKIDVLSDNLLVITATIFIILNTFISLKKT